LYADTKEADDEEASIKTCCNPYCRLFRNVSSLEDRKEAMDDASFMAKSTTFEVKGEGLGPKTQNPSI
jgi:hypothetical protein